LAPEKPVIGVDTNVLVRLFVLDDPTEAAAVRKLFAGGKIAIAHTVLLETEWVLRRRFNFSRQEIGSAFLRLFGLPNVFCPRPEMVLTTLDAFEAGCDFADALHAATSERDVVEFVTFDRDFAALAGRQGLLPPVRLLAQN
jgi:predicted nucleic-acid-binding protein